LRLPAGRFTFRAHGGERIGLVEVEVEGAVGDEILIVVEG
jgi:hypothetical protein